MNNVNLSKSLSAASADIMKSESSSGPLKASHSFHVPKTEPIGGIPKPAFGSKLSA